MYLERLYTVYKGMKFTGIYFIFYGCMSKQGQIIVNRIYLDKFCFDSINDKITIYKSDMSHYCPR